MRTVHRIMCVHNIILIRLILAIKRLYSLGKSSNLTSPVTFIKYIYITPFPINSIDLSILRIIISSHYCSNIALYLYAMVHSCVFWVQSVIIYWPQVVSFDRVIKSDTYNIRVKSTSIIDMTVFFLLSPKRHRPIY